MPGKNRDPACPDTAFDDGHLRERSVCIVLCELIICTIISLYQTSHFLNQLPSSPVWPFELHLYVYPSNKLLPKSVAVIASEFPNRVAVPHCLNLLNSMSAATLSARQSLSECIFSLA